MFKRILTLSVGPPEAWVLQKLQRLHSDSEVMLRLELFPSSSSLISRFFQPDAKVALVAEALSEQWQRHPVIDDAQFAGLEVSVEINSRPLNFTAVDEVVNSFAPDLIVKACRRHHRLDQYLLGHIDWQLIRQSPVPVMLLRPGPWPDNAVVCAAVDPMRAHHQPAALDEQIVRRALELAQRLGGRADLVHAYQPLPAAVILDDSLMLDYNLLKQRMEEEHRQAVEQFVDRLGLAEEIRITLVKGEPAMELPRYCAEQRACVVVMGAMDRGGLEELFVGSTTEAVLEQLEGDLLVVPAAGILPEG